MKNNWPPISQITKNGKKVWQVAARFTNANGERVGERRTFVLKKEAEGWADQVRIAFKNQGAGTFDNEELKSFGWTVSDAIRFALEHLRKQKGSVSVETAITELIETKRRAGRSKRYCHDLALRLGRFSAAFKGKTVGEITTAELNDFLASLKVAAGTWNTFRRDIRTLWSFAEDNKWAEAVTAKKTQRAKGKSTAPAILTPEQTATLLAESNDDELLAYHAIGVFAGLRVSEIMKIQWGRHVNLSKGFIELDASITKTGQRRLVPILPNLRAWLEPIAKPSGMVITGRLRVRHDAARERAGITWSEHIMRHSFASYRLAEVQNAPQVSLETGHSVAILYHHYRELVMRNAAKAYFGIFPSVSAGEKDCADLGLKFREIFSCLAV
jgi:site-specific recombinase XerD